MTTSVVPTTTTTIDVITTADPTSTLVLERSLRKAGYETVSAPGARLVELKPGAARMLPFLLGVQFHPERLVKRHREHRAIFAAFVQACARNGKFDL